MSEHAKTKHKIQVVQLEHLSQLIKADIVLLIEGIRRDRYRNMRYFMIR